MCWPVVVACVWPCAGPRGAVLSSRVFVTGRVLAHGDHVCPLVFVRLRSGRVRARCDIVMSSAVCVRLFVCVLVVCGPVVTS